jgi:hypothetical protein
MPTIGEILQMKTSLGVGSAFDDHCLAKSMKDDGMESLVKPQGRAMITRKSRSALGQSKRHTSHLKSQ